LLASHGCVLAGSFRHPGSPPNRAAHVIPAAAQNAPHPEPSVKTPAHVVAVS
jgi:hypothetical protein